MSHKEFYKKAAVRKADPSTGATKEVTVDRFSDVRKVDRRRHEVLDYLILGFSEEEIAEFMGEKKQVILSDVEAIVEAGFEAREEEVAEVRDEIMRIYRIAVKESFKAFKDSQGEIETITTETGTDGKGRPIDKEKIKTEKQSGDSRHMRNMIEAAEKMGKVTGAQKHKEVEVQQNIQKNSVNILSPERTKMPEAFDRWTKKPEDKEIPDGREVKAEEPDESS